MENYFVNYCLSLFLGIIGGVLIKAFYSMIEKEEPKLYVYNATYLERSSGKVTWAYCAFRSLPVFVVCLGVSVTSDRLGLVGGLAVFGCAGLFVCLSSVRAIYDRVSRFSRRPFVHVGLQVFDIILTVVFAWIAYKCSSVMAIFVPDPKEFVTAIWTALFVALVVHFVRQVGKREGGPEKRELLVLVKKDVGVELWNWAKGVADGNGVPWCVVAAIIMVEASERPRWIRQVERCISAVCFHRITMSFGVTQEQSMVPLSDQQAIEITINWIKENLSDGSARVLKGWDRGPGKLSEALDEVQSLADRRNCDGRYGEAIRRYAEYIYSNKESKL
jgi:membrane protein